MMTNDANQDDKDDQEKHGLHNQQAKALDATLKLGLGCAACQSYGDIAKGSVAPRCSDESAPQAADDEGPKKDAIASIGKTLGGIAVIACTFLRWQVGATSARSFSTLFWERDVCTKLRMLLSRTMTTMMLASTGSPGIAETTLATSKMAISGFKNRRKNWITDDVCFRPVMSLGPYLSSRWLASLPVNPCSLLSSCVNSFCNGTIWIRAFSSSEKARVACGGNVLCILHSKVVLVYVH
jgi:hypothetical protein